MTRVRVLAPALVDFREPLGAFRYARSESQAFWTALEDWAPAFLQARGPDPTLAAPAVSAGWKSPRGRFNRYDDIRVDTLERPVEALELLLEPGHVDVALPACVDPGAPLAISCRLYDHSICLVEVEAGLRSPTDSSPQGVEQHLATVQQAMVAWGEELARELHRRFLSPLVAEARRRDRDEAGVEERSQEVEDGDGSDFGEVLWVTRSLLVDAADPVASLLQEAWVGAGGVAGATAGQLAPDPTGRAHLIRWLNYLFVFPPGTMGGVDTVEGTFGDEWRALRLAQYFYAALENIDVQLDRVLARSLAPFALATVKDLKGELEGCSRRAEFIVMQLRTTTKYVTRPVRTELEGILEYWDFEQVVEEPVQMKVQACERRLRELSERRSARSAIFTDVILLGIGVTSILGTTLALTEFGRTMSVDPGMAGYDTGRNAVIRWIAAQPADLLLFAAAGVSLVLSVVYLYFRRNNSS
ncbi:hypothetical protein [Nocardioides sp.]|uniref:hypothetical protein n=1 Tax=Nocardioides sp. TaxID=35761 RepID=UPI00321B038B